MITEAELEGIDKNLSYDPETGVFKYLTKRGRKNKDLTVSSKDRHGYIRVSYKGKRYLGHRVAFYLMKGFWPKQDVDHIDGNRANNKWGNLREASRSENLWNQKVTRGESKYKGVVRSGRGWVAQVSKKPDKYYLGYYLSQEEAALVYNYKAQELFGVFSRFNQVFKDVPQEVLNVEA